MDSIHAWLKNPLTIPLMLLIGTVVAGLIIRTLIFRAVRVWARRTGSELHLIFSESFYGPFILWSLILGIHLATQHSEIPRRYLHYIPPTLAALWILSLSIVMSRVAGNAVRRYGGNVLPVTSLTEKLAEVLVFALGVLWILKVVLNISLTPFLATLGVGGLAIALGLQDTLSNLFAGFYVSISGLLHIGDYIKLNTGEEGYVTDINWRCTTIRGITNNLVVIPNNKLGQAIFTNFSMPDPRMAMSISFGVGYDSDVTRVELLLLEETLAAQGAVAGLLADPPPYVRFTPGPGDWALGFQLNFSVAQFSDQYLVQSELRKRIFNRLRSEGITMPFPTRTVILEQPKTS
ncbi:MAG TPA: mechanosensitive ion channel family protein [Bryobacteraceae bacterium]|jgi:small-conductance mechanosensitive channel|nr:mechanosensitive ion channel family protein [Bryobacteraceae bacterium]